MPATTCFWKRMPGWCYSKATEKYCRASGKLCFLFPLLKCLCYSVKWLVQWEFVPSPSVPLHPNNKQAERHSHSEVGGTALLTKQGMQQVALGFSFCPVCTAYGSKTSLGSIWGNFSPPCPLCFRCSHCCCPSFMQKEACWAQGQYSLFELHLCTPSAIKAKLHLHILLLPYNTAQVWTWTGMSCLSKYIDRMVSLDFTTP